jgi:hypothetical protein
MPGPVTHALPLCINQSCAWQFVLLHAFARLVESIN